MILLSGYHTSSHKYWASQLLNIFPDMEILSMPARHFAWRFQANSLHYYQWLQNKQFSGPVITTSMVNLGMLKGLFPPLAQQRILLYFHENQFAYPDRHTQGHTERLLTSIYSALAADSIAFNSAYNRKTFLAGVTNFLKRMPDFNDKNFVDILEKKSRVIPVPVIDRETTVNFSSLKAPLQIVWNHRWEYDKDPQTLFYFLKHLDTSEIRFNIAIVGQTFRQTPPEFEKIKQHFSNVISVWGFIEDRQDYETLLHNSDIVLSTSIHDFQGIAMQEAIAHNCIPIAPHDLGYSEFIPSQYLYPMSDHPEEKALHAFSCLQDIISNIDTLPPIDLTKISLRYLSNIYKKWVFEK